MVPLSTSLSILISSVIVACEIGGVSNPSGLLLGYEQQFIALVSALNQLALVGSSDPETEAITSVRRRDINVLRR